MVIGVKTNQQNGNVKLKKMGSDLVVQRSRYHHLEAFARDLQDGHVSSLWGSQTNQEDQNVRLKKLGSDLVVQRSRYHNL